MARVQGVTGVSSSSSYGRSQVTLTFADGTNLDGATSDVRDATARVINKLPDGVDLAHDRQGRRQRLRRSCSSR